MKKDLFKARSKVHGNGIFTKKSFKKGDIIFILKGKKRKFKIRSKADSRKFDSLAPNVANWIRIDKDTWIDSHDGFSDFLNHSCNPNVGIKGRVTFVALQNIRAGDELTLDYSITEEDIHWKFKCHCGAKKCRKIVRSVQYLPQNCYRRYFPFIPSHSQRVYNNSSIKNG